MELTDTVKPWEIDPPDEPCGGADAQPVFSFAAPPEFLQPAISGLPSSEGRLRERLRKAAERKDATEILADAARVFYRAAHVLDSEIGFENSERLGNALADLAVTGREAYKSWPVNETSLKSRLPAAATAADVDAAVGAALDRAYAVAWALRGPAAQRAAARAPLGWIAVSAEDDTPHRPVNLAAPKIPGGVEIEQFEIPVSTNGIPVRTRFFIASAVDDVVPAGVVVAKRALPPDPVPLVPGGHEVILFLHGHSSSAEEALTIIPHIHAAGLARGRKYSVISFDLPNSGYSEMFDHTRIRGETTFPADPGSGELIRTPILDFTEDFVVAFVNALDDITPVKSRFAGVIGGSLGGNLGLRLGRRRDLAANPWLNAGIVSWSAASVWKPLGENFFKSIGPGTALARSKEPEALRSRADYFFDAYDYTLPFVNRKSPELWYSKDWVPCKDFHIAASRIARQEIYNANFRRWHWRLAGEQLVYSHVDRFIRGDPNSHLRYEDNTVRQLLVAGEDDDFKFSNIFPATQKLAKRMVNTPGRSLFLAKTGHSIHVERPRYFAGEIIRFLAEAQRATPDSSFLGRLLLSDPVPARPVAVTPDISFLGPLLLSDPVPARPAAVTPDISFLGPLLLSDPVPTPPVAVTPDISFLAPLLLSGAGP
jgi:pimeloyl-ACP methyl ester carboxylesterase